MKDMHNNFTTPIIVIIMLEPQSVSIMKFLKGV